jgi:hypothetical protein
MPYKVGAKGSFGCSGYPALKEGTNEVMGCHTSRAEAAAQIFAINRSEGNIGKSMHVITEGDFVMGMTKEGLVHGMVEHIMTEGGTLGTPGSEYALESMPPENPAMSVRIYEEEDGGWEPTAYSIGMMYKDAELININDHSMEEESDMDAYDNSIGKVYEGCGCPTCKALNVNCQNCPVSLANVEKAKPNYADMIEPRRGGSTPANPKLYARVVQAAKDKFDVYPSAVANSWVVQEYKRRGGTYKFDSVQETKSVWSGLFDPKGFNK